MSAGPSASTTPDFPGGPAPTRVLEELGGSTAPRRSKAAVATLVSGVIAVAAGGIYWANTSNTRSTLATNQAAPAVRVASAAPVTAAPGEPALAPPASITAAPVPVAVPEPVAAAARIVNDDAPAGKMAPLVAEAPVVAAASASAAAPITSRVAKARTPRVLSANSRTAAQREKARTAAAKPDGKPTAIAAKKPRGGKQTVASNQAGKPPATRRPDPDTDLLAALLRRNDGQAQASLAQKERVR